MYDDLIATHYAAYRPPVHEVILKRALASPRDRTLGLDIGCGTGRSSGALAMFCSRVVGLDPSEAMLGRAGTQEKVRFINASAERIPLTGRSVDVVTFAGSLNYIDRTKLIDELIRVCRPDAEIVIYDFAIDLSKIEEQLALKRDNDSTEYDYACNLSGFSGVRELSVVDDTLSLSVGPSEIAHLLLSESRNHEALGAKYLSRDLDRSLRTDLADMKPLSAINVRIYYSLYALQ